MPSIPPDPNVLDALRERLPMGHQAMPLDDFIECVLYHPSVGYYMRDKDRVGYRPETDFYTASSMGAPFSKLVLSAIEDLLGDNLPEYAFIEAGPESSGGILGAIDANPFRQHLLFRPGDPIRIPDKAIVFSNELFDAQPFKRYIHTGTGWREVGVSISRNDLGYCILEPADIPSSLPDSAPEGYLIDWPLHAHRLLDDICSQPWEGLFIAFDYGLDRSIVFEQRPEGTGRTYYQHQLGSDLLANPGLTDITCHLVWDEMEERLNQHDFGQVQLMRQESFFMKHAQSQIQIVMESSPAGFSRDKQTLMELLHPGNMGHKFQVLIALRGEL
jgi:SAM-dependent MidA family methyltransferase